MTLNVGGQMFTTTRYRVTYHRQSNSALYTTTWSSKNCGHTLNVCLFICCCHFVLFIFFINFYWTKRTLQLISVYIRAVEHCPLSNTCMCLFFKIECLSYTEINRNHIDCINPPQVHEIVIILKLIWNCIVFSSLSSHISPHCQVFKSKRK